MQYYGNIKQKEKKKKKNYWHFTLKKKDKQQYCGVIHTDTWSDVILFTHIFLQFFQDKLLELPPTTQLILLITVL